LGLSSLEKNGVTEGLVVLSASTVDIHEIFIKVRYYADCGNEKALIST
jgi:hypothetical protein